MKSVVEHLSWLPSECIEHVMDYLDIAKVIALHDLGYIEAARHQYRKRTHHFDMLHLTDSGEELRQMQLRRIGQFVRRLSISFDSQTIGVGRFLEFLQDLYGSEQPINSQCVSHQFHSISFSSMDLFRQSSTTSALTHLKMLGLIGKTSTLAASLAIFTNLKQLIVYAPKYTMTDSDTAALLKLPALTHLTLVCRSLPLDDIMTGFIRTNQLIVLNVETSTYQITAPKLRLFCQSMTKLQGFGFSLLNNKKMELRNVDFFQMLSKTGIQHLILPYSDLRLDDCPASLLAQLKTLKLELDEENIWSENVYKSTELMEQLCALDTLRLISVCNGEKREYENKVHGRRQYLGYNDFDVEKSTAPECIRTVYGSCIEAGEHSMNKIGEICLKLQQAKESSTRENISYENNVII